VKYEGVSKSFRTESITKYKLAFDITRWEATQRLMEAKLTILTYKMAIQLHLVAECCTICSSRSRQPVRKLLATPSYIHIYIYIYVYVCVCVCVCVYIYMLPRASHHSGNLFWRIMGVHEPKVRAAVTCFGLKVIWGSQLISSDRCEKKRASNIRRTLGMLYMSVCRPASSTKLLKGFWLNLV
jgi:hypothetical protein